jgi:methylmalonyl-CoA mutase cobalamin-binding domain/chain
MADDLMTALVNLREEACLKLVEERLHAGEDPREIWKEAREAMEIIGRWFEDGKYFIPELVYSGEILKEISARVKPGLAKAVESRRCGSVVIATVAGDIHDIGKNIVAFMLDINGFEVHDLGVDVPPRKLVEKIEEVEPEIVGLSGFLTLSYGAMKGTIDAIQEAGLRDRVKIMVGGGVMDDGVRKWAGADAYGPDALAAVSLSKAWVSGK